MAAPSRIYRLKSHKLPLADTQIVVKDMSDIGRLRTSIGNSDFVNLYLPYTETASITPRLIDAAAECLG